MKKIKLKKIIILNDTSFELHHGCMQVMKNIKELALENNMEIICTNPTGIDWRKNSSFMESIPKCHLVLVNGEGTLHHAQLSAKYLITIGKYIKKYFRIPVVLINSTYQDNGDEIAEYTKFFDLIYVRETLSKKELIKYGIKSKVIPDLSFYSRYDLTEKKTGKFVGVTDSVYLDQSQKLLEMALTKKFHFLPILTFPNINKSFKSFVNHLRLSIFKKLSPILNKAGYKFNHKITKTFFYTDDYENYIKKISGLNFLIVARYHSLCFALKTLTPFVAIEFNSFRMKGLLEDVGIGVARIKPSCNLNKFSLKKFNRNEKAKITAYVSAAPFRIELMFKEIRELIHD